MMLNEGVANGRRIVSADWVPESTKPSTVLGDDFLAGYGYQWWMAPKSRAYYALGLQGQFIYVDPETRTVVVKLSYDPPGDRSADAKSVAFFAAVSAWQPD